MNKDHLDLMFKLQEHLQSRLNNDMMSQEYRTTMILAAVDELMEALRETPWKPWKKNQSFNNDRNKEEIIDLWHFVINISLSAGYDARSLYDDFIAKHAINHKRQDDGY